MSDEARMIQLLKEIRDELKKLRYAVEGQRADVDKAVQQEDNPMRALLANVKGIDNRRP